jgi:hypothetical protein
LQPKLEISKGPQTGCSRTKRPDSEVRDDKDKESKAANRSIKVNVLVILNLLLLDKARILYLVFLPT